MKRIPVIQDAP